jgi:hypothetical protein
MDLLKPAAGIAAGVASLAGGLAMEGLSAVIDALPPLALAKKAFKLGKAIVTACKLVQHNKENFAALSKRMEALGGPLGEISSHFERAGKAAEAGKPALLLLNKSLISLLELASEHQLAGMLKRALGKFRERFQAADDDLTQAMGDLHFAMQADTARVLDQLLRQTAVTLKVDEKLRQVLEAVEHAEEEGARRDKALLKALEEVARGNAPSLDADSLLLIPPWAVCRDIGAELIGSGAFGKVHAAHYCGALVAEKQLDCVDLLSSGVAKDLLHEARVLAEMRHPRIVRFYGAVFAPPRHSLISEYIDGGSLNERLNKRTPLTWPQRVRVALEVAQGLAYLHNRPLPIVHGDLKPTNVLLKTEVDGMCGAVLSDMGLSQAHRWVVGVGDIGYE